MDKKECFKCKDIKPLDDFYAHPGMADGKVNKCKTCNKADNIANRLKNIEHYKEYDKNRQYMPSRVKAREEYAKTERGKLAGNRGKNKWRALNQDKAACSTLVNNSIKRGKLTKEPCKICGSTKRIHGHHDDYTKPLDVIWLCSKHHRYHHKIMGSKPFDIGIFKNESKDLLPVQKAETL